MKFKDTYKVVYCKDNYNKKYNNDRFYYNNDIQYYKGYLIHREDGPAIECKDGDKYWYLNGKEYSEQKYLKIINLKKKSQVLDEI
jgi:hypothetical protein